MSEIRNIRRTASWLNCMLIVVFLSACASPESGSPNLDTQNPVARSLNWFSYIGGDDIRTSCQVNGIDRYRFVYNGHYELQIRGYDLTPVEGGADFLIRARGRSGNIGLFALNEPFGPWKLLQGQVMLTNTEASKIVRALSEDAAAAPPSAGQNMMSYEFFWIVSACSRGKFRLVVFRHPQIDINKLAFVPLLLAHDTSGVAFAKARRVEGLQQRSFGVAVNRQGTALVR